MGAHLNAYTSREHTTYYAKVRARNAAATLVAHAGLTRPLRCAGVQEGRGQGG
jgi:hypothetical protein